jgi:hypothetical protein
MSKSSSIIYRKVANLVIRLIQRLSAIEPL